MCRAGREACNGTYREALAWGCVAPGSHAGNVLGLKFIENSGAYNTRAEHPRRGLAGALHTGKFYRRAEQLDKFNQCLSAVEAVESCFFPRK